MQLSVESPILIVVALFCALVLGVFADQGSFERRLLHSDPASLPGNEYLLGRAAMVGKALFESYCVACHGSAARGDSSKGIPDLTDSDWLYGSGQISDIERVVTYGIRSRNPKALNFAIMPAFGRVRPSPTNDKIAPLSPADVNDVIDFIYQQQHRPSDALAAERGSAIYYSRGACFDCHTTDLRGDPEIGAPNLIDEVTLYGSGGRESLFLSITIGRQGVCPAWIRKISPAGIRSVSVFVYSLSHPRSSQHAKLQSD